MKQHLIGAALVALLACVLAVPCMADSSKAASYDSVHCAVRVHANGTAEVQMDLEVVLPADGEGMELPFYDPHVINSFTVQRVAVTGSAACSVTNNSGVAKVTLGGAEETGRQSFTVTYEMEFRDDLEDAYDWFDISFFAGVLEGRVRSFTAEVICPETATVQAWELLDDSEGAKSPQGIKGSFDSGVFKIWSTQELNGYDEVFLHVQCESGLFLERQSPVGQRVITQRVCSISVSPEMVYTINERITLQANSKAGYVTLPMLRFDAYDTSFTMELLSQSVNVRKDEHEYRDSLSLYLDAGDTTGVFPIEYTYTVRPARLDTPFALVLDNGACDRVDNMTLTFTAPGLREAQVRVENSVLAYVPTGERVQATLSGNVLTAALQKPLYAYEALSLTAKHDETLYVRKGAALRWLLPGGALLCVLLCVLLKVFLGTPRRVKGMRQPGVPVPPYHITSAEAGYLKDGVLTAEELSTLVLQWVALGAVTMEESDGEYILSLHTIPLGLPDWELTLLHTMFGLGNGVHVTTVQLRGKLDAVFAAAQQAVQRQYQGERALQAGGAGQWACMALAALPMFLLGVLAATVEDWGLLLGVGVGIGCMAVQLLLSCLWLPVCKRRMGALVQRASAVTLRDGLLVLLLLVCAALYTVVLKSLFPLLPVTTAALTILLCLGAALAGALFLRRRPMAQTLLAEVNGFHAALAALTPETMRAGQRTSQHWCYEILPYAMVFGLTMEWKNAAKDAEVPVPRGIHGVQSFTEYAEQAQQLVTVLKRCASLTHLR